MPLYWCGVDGDKVWDCSFVWMALVTHTGGGSLEQKSQTFLVGPSGLYNTLMMLVGG